MPDETTTEDCLRATAQALTSENFELRRDLAAAKRQLDRLQQENEKLRAEAGGTRARITWLLEGGEL